MSTQPNPQSTIDDVRELCVDFGIPVVVLVILAALMLTGTDGEVKTLMASVVGWLVKSGITRRKK